MSGDDDDGGVIIRRKVHKLKESLTKPVARVQRWHLVAIAFVAFCIGLSF